MRSFTSTNPQCAILISCHGKVYGFTTLRSTHVLVDTDGVRAINQGLPLPSVDVSRFIVLRRLLARVYPRLKPSQTRCSTG
ncbi:hypothetical protein RRG08_063600 [Elysia crispata]|uniref:Uncharacterized protein n=1 Tax=Elysia crispata TaxID=231223 RepID=A0AAE0YSR1_9GAST|nr:hypothetical protein RRG08_063600 [Elysia crispata]